VQRTFTPAYLKSPVSLFAVELTSNPPFDCHCSWRAYRFQPHIVLSEEELAKIKEEKAAAFRKTLQTPVYKDEDERPSFKKTPSVTPTKNLFAMPTWSSPFGSSSFGSPTSASSAPVTSTSEDQDLEALLKKRDTSLSTQASAAKKTVSSSSPSLNTKSIPSEHVASSSSSLSTTTSSVATISYASSSQEDSCFAEAYIEFDKEPEIVSYSGEFHEYEKKAKEVLSEGADGTWAGEGYESSVTAKDKPFHRFHKRLQRSPEQCLRYWRGAEPLFSSADKPKNVPLCACGARRVPETQLTPALIYLLKCVNEKNETNLDFGTVIIYTCGANCTSEGSPLHLEHMEVQKGV